MTGYEVEVDGEPWHVGSDAAAYDATHAVAGALLGGADRVVVEREDTTRTLRPAEAHPDVAEHVVEAIRANEDKAEDGAPVAHVIEDTADVFTLGTAFDVIRDLHEHGEIYAPSKFTLRVPSNNHGADE